MLEMKEETFAECFLQQLLLFFFHFGQTYINQTNLQACGCSQSLRWNLLSQMLPRKLTPLVENDAESSLQLVELVHISGENNGSKTFVWKLFHQWSMGPHEKNKDANLEAMFV